MTAFDATSAQTFAKAWAAAWNDRDVEGVLAHFADDAVFTSPIAARLVGDGVVRGKDAIRAYWNLALTKITDLDFDLIGVFVGAQTMVIHYTNQSGTQCAEVLTFGADGLVVTGHGTYLPNE